MPRFKVSSSFSGNAKEVRAKQTSWNQRMAAKQNRPPKWFRRMLKRSKRFSLPWLTNHRVRRQRKAGVVA